MIGCQVTPFDVLERQTDLQHPQVALTGHAKGICPWRWIPASYKFSKASGSCSHSIAELPARALGFGPDYRHRLHTADNVTLAFIIQRWLGYTSFTGTARTRIPFCRL